MNSLFNNILINLVWNKKGCSLTIPPHVIIKLPALSIEWDRTKHEWDLSLCQSATPTQPQLHLRCCKYVSKHTVQNLPAPEGKPRNPQLCPASKPSRNRLLQTFPWHPLVLLVQSCLSLENQADSWFPLFCSPGIQAQFQSCGGLASWLSLQLSFSHSHCFFPFVAIGVFWRNESLDLCVWQTSD